MVDESQQRYVHQPQQQQRPQYIHILANANNGGIRPIYHHQPIIRNQILPQMLSSTSASSTQPHRPQQIITVVKTGQQQHIQYTQHQQQPRLVRIPNSGAIVRGQLLPQMLSTRPRQVVYQQQTRVKNEHHHQQQQIFHHHQQHQQQQAIHYSPHGYPIQRVYHVPSGMVVRQASTATSTVAAATTRQVIKQEIISSDNNINNGIMIKNEMTEIAEQVLVPQVKSEPNEMMYQEDINPSQNGFPFEQQHQPPPKTEPTDIPPAGGGDGGNIDVSIKNVVCNYSLPMHVDLKKLALNTWNCQYDRSGSVLMKQMRNPECHAKIYNSGKVYIVGCRSENDSRRAARRMGREIQNIMGKTQDRVTLRKFRINNIMATCRLPFGIAIHEINRKYPKETYYEPELTVGLIWKMIEPKASLRIHTTGTIVVTGATSENDVMIALGQIYNYVSEFRCDPSKLSRIQQSSSRKRPTPNNNDAIDGIDSKLGIKRIRGGSTTHQQQSRQPKYDVDEFDEEDNISGNRSLWEDEADLYDDDDIL